MKKHIFFFLALLILSFGCSKDDLVTVPGEAPYKAGNGEKNIKFVKSSGTLEYGYYDDYTMYYDINGGGNATFIGKFTVVNHGVVDITDYIPGDPMNIISWEGIITAANGDQIFTEMVYGPYFPEGPEVAYYNYEVTGGNGRFEGATGGDLVMYGSTDQVNGTWELKGEGTIYFE